jgi:hypothetical protein
MSYPAPPEDLMAGWTRNLQSKQSLTGFSVKEKPNELEAYS